ncbi:general transcription factor 3C polypeptide 2 [Trichinella spiralis]|uniref:general transcription factor 3C polypeptide 2 n=1 Tax=Trichinella spiralis TaxID=6334 RepID=UPI0001EFD4FC|nr:general transcription factor 3C polypeptide 2 [Trichinella spiralis]
MATINENDINICFVVVVHDKLGRFHTRRVWCKIMHQSRLAFVFENEIVGQMCPKMNLQHIVAVVVQIIQLQCDLCICKIATATSTLPRTISSLTAVANVDMVHFPHCYHDVLHLPPPSKTNKIEH